MTRAGRTTKSPNLTALLRQMRGRTTQERLTEEARVQITLEARCWACRVRHTLCISPPQLTGAIWDWEAKHRGHPFEFLLPRRRFLPRFSDRLWQRLGWAPWWLTWRENANFRVAYASSAALTCTLASLASSSTFLVGQEATAVLNDSPITSGYLDIRLKPKITTGTTPTVDTEIRLYGYAALNDTPTYPDTITGTDGTRTLTNAAIRDSGFRLLGGTFVSAASNIGYPFECVTLARAFGHVPKRWGLYVTHNTVAALHATAGNHVLTQNAASLVTS